MGSARSSGKHDAPVILRIDWNCSEVDRDYQLFYKHDGKFYDVCCDSENKDAPECADLVWLGWLFVGINIVILSPFICAVGYYCKILFWDCVKTCCNKCYNACCEPQPIVRSDNNATRYGTERSNISTINANISQPSIPPP